MGIPGLGGSGATAARHTPRTVAGWRATAGLLGGTSLSRLSMFGAGAMGTAAAGVGLAAVGGYGAGSLIHDVIDGSNFENSLAKHLAYILAGMGNATAQQAVEDNRNAEAVLRIKIEGAKATLESVESPGSFGEIEVESGMTMGGG